jgi:putative ABC transport system permease protein
MTTSTRLIMLLNYLKIAFRNFWKQPLFSGLNVVGLGVGMGAVWLMMLYVTDELSYDRFHTKADRIFRVVQDVQWATGGFHFPLTSAPFAGALKNEYPEIVKTVRINTEGGGMLRYLDKRIDVNDIFFTDSTFFDIFSYQFLYGSPRTSLKEPGEMVLTKTLAEKLFGSAADAMNKTVFLSNNYPNTISGVIEDAPANSHFHFSALRSLSRDYTSRWQESSLYTYILIGEDVDYQRLERKTKGFFAKYLEGEMGKVNYKLELQPITSIHLHSHLDYEIGTNNSINTIYVFSFVAALILAIACINYVNLYTARSLKRLREVGVRKAIGSRRFQLTIQFLMESVMMALFAGLVGLLLVWMALPFFNELAGKSFSVTSQHGASTATMVGAFVLLIGCLSGLYPALVFSGIRPVQALKGTSGHQDRGSRFRHSLVIFQFAATVVLISCAAVVYRQMYFVAHKDLGFYKDQVVIFHIDKHEVRKQIAALKNKLSQSVLIENVASASNPMGNNTIGSTGVFVETNTGEMPASTQVLQTFSVDADYLETLGIRLLAGRNFRDSSPADFEAAVMVNESLVKKQGWANPIGKRLESIPNKDGKSSVFRVIGVMKDFHTYSLQHKIEPLVVTLAEIADRDNVYVRIKAGRAQEALTFIKGAFKKFDTDSAPDFHFLDENFAGQYKAEERQGRVILVFAMLTVIIACLGLFGLTAFAAESRTREIGIRKVMGASVQHVILLLSADFVKLILIAIVVGTPIAFYGMNEWLKNFEYREDLSWWIFAMSGVVSMVIGLLTVSSQALKSALMNPVNALKAE